MDMNYTGLTYTIWNLTLGVENRVVGGMLAASNGWRAGRLHNKPIFCRRIVVFGCVPIVFGHCWLKWSIIQIGIR